MSSVGLLFVGAVLFVNGLLFLGRVDPRSAALLNLFVGALQTAVPFYLVATAATPDEVLAAAGIFLFGFTYLYVGIGNLAGHDGGGLGWYSAWVALLAAGFGVVNIVRFDDPTTGLLWLQWSALWAVFWVVLALGVERLTPAAGWLTLILSFTTCTVPGFLLLLGEWGRVPVWAVLASMVATAAVVVPIALRTPQERPAPATDVPAPAAA
ncbi:AmiS/UreI family transporter [Nocardioides sp. TF02-7]|uniref:AmiS/UreI family transporter n=1 Tax=Nocardioides sp. TF02-7 TaxID=2917724 RepID=UPI001F065F67|nr:AmiS/UreI family transporter [Nocardioides sp. TF02-7]UMG93514.1 AmiS/UreI family transporter [Nocardioides sp. TF02-7]